MDAFIPTCSLPPTIAVLFTTRIGGVSDSPYHTLNLSCTVGDEEEAVYENRLRLRERLPNEPAWIRQVHGNRAIHADSINCDADIADASYTATPEVVCVVQTADCLPVLLYAIDGKSVAAIHAGWRGLAAGVIKNTIDAMQSRTPLAAIIGPHISAAYYCIGNDTRQALCHQEEDQKAFVAATETEKWHTDLSVIAANQLRRANIDDIFFSNRCTYAEKDFFFSARRDKAATGRQAAVIYIK